MIWIARLLPRSRGRIIPTRMHPVVSLLTNQSGTDRRSWRITRVSIRQVNLWTGQPVRKSSWTEERVRTCRLHWSAIKVFTQVSWPQSTSSTLTSLITATTSETRECNKLIMRATSAPLEDTLALLGKRSLEWTWVHSFRLRRWSTATLMFSISKREALYLSSEDEYWWQGTCQ